MHILFGSIFYDFLLLIAMITTFLGPICVDNHNYQAECNFTLLSYSLVQLPLVTGMLRYIQ